MTSWKGDTVLCLNVGGTKFYCSLCTLITAKGSYFEARFASEFRPGGHFSQNESEPPEFFIDRDPKCFPYILQFLRDQQTRLPSDLLPFTPEKESLWECLEIEADFYCLDRLLSMLRQAKQEACMQHFPPSPDGKGILYHIGTNYGKSNEYQNPFLAGSVKVVRATDPGEEAADFWSDQDLISGTDKARANFVSHKPLYCSFERKAKRRAVTSSFSRDEGSGSPRRQAEVDGEEAQDIEEGDEEDFETPQNGQETPRPVCGHEICVPYTADVFSCCLYDGRISDHGMRQFYVTLELPGDVHVRPTHYSMRHSGINCPCGMESWDFLGSEDGKKWDLLHAARRDTPLNLDEIKDSTDGTSGLMELLQDETIDDHDLDLLAEGLLERTRRTFAIPKKDKEAKFYRCFRVASIPRDDVPRDLAPCMHGAGLELYGDVENK